MVRPTPWQCGDRARRASKTTLVASLAQSRLPAHLDLQSDTDRAVPVEAAGLERLASGRSMSQFVGKPPVGRPGRTCAPALRAALSKFTLVTE